MITKIPVSEPTISEQDIKTVKKCMESGWISSAGPAIYRFGRKFAKFIGTKYALPVSTGTAALHLALLAIGVKPSDEVIMPALTFVSPASMTTALGARAIFVDVVKNTFLIDPAKIEAKITSKTKAIIAVHLYGYPADLDPILRIANKYRLKIIEDCAEALGATYHGKKVGSFGNVTCFSFYGNKFITTGEGGILSTNCARIYKKAQLYCDHGMRKEKRYYHQVVGYNYRLTAIQASLGISQLKRIKTFLRLRKKINDNYKKELKGLRKIQWAQKTADSEPVCWLTTILLPNKKTRDRLWQFLKEKGVETRKVFYPLPNMPPYPAKESFPYAQEISQRGLSLPTFTHIKAAQIKFVSKAIKEFLEN